MAASNSKSGKTATPAGSVLKRNHQIVRELLASGSMPTPGVLVKSLLDGFQHVYDPDQLLGAGAPAEEPVRLQRRRPYNAIFVSPSVREGSTIDQAFHHFQHSPDLKRLEQETPGGKSGIGFWKDGAEESRFVPHDDPATINQRAAQLGHTYRQKGVIHFTENGSGTDLAHILVVPQEAPARIHHDLMRHGVEYKTVVPGKPGTSVVHILDGEGAQKDSVAAYAKEVGARHVSFPGHIGFIGADDRDGAAQEYQKVLGASTAAPQVASPPPKEDPVAL